MYAGSQGIVDAGLVSLCVEKLIQEENTELKVKSFINSFTIYPLLYY